MSCGKCIDREILQIVRHPAAGRYCQPDPVGATATTATATGSYGKDLLKLPCRERASSEILQILWRTFPGRIDYQKRVEGAIARAESVSAIA